MNTFNEADHPRNNGKFTDKIQSVSTVTLGNRFEDYTSPDRFVEMASTSFGAGRDLLAHLRERQERSCAGQTISPIGTWARRTRTSPRSGRAQPPARTHGDQGEVQHVVLAVEDGDAMFRRERKDFMRDDIPLLGSVFVEELDVDGDRTGRFEVLTRGEFREQSMEREGPTRS